MKHMFKPGEKEAVAGILGIPVEEIPDVLNLGVESEEEDEDEDTESDTEEEEEDDEEEDDEEEDDEDDDSEDEDEEESRSNIELLRLKDEWEQDYQSQMAFSEFLKLRGK